MPRSHYRRHVNDDDDDELGEMTRTEIVFAQMTARGRHWPKTIGVVEIVVGMIITFLGTLEVFVIPMIESDDGTELIILDKRNCYGCGLFAGLVMVVTGSTAIRASLSQRNTTVYRFFNLTIVCLLIYTGLSLFLIVAYSNGWTSPDAYKTATHIQEVHVFVTIFTVMGLLFSLTAFVQYFDVICCGEYPLWVQWAKCVEPCCCCCRQQVAAGNEVLVSVIGGDKVNDSSRDEVDEVSYSSLEISNREIEHCIMNRD